MTAMWRRRVPVCDIAAEFGVKRPAVYKALRSTGALPPYGVSRSDPKAPPKPRSKRKPVIDPALIVFRDPCPRCGVRGDIGCQHSAALSQSQRQGMPQQRGA